MRATTLSLWTSSPAHRGYSTSTDIPPRSVLRSGLGRNPGYRNLICVLRSASARGNNSGCSQGLGSNLLTGSEHQGLADLIPDATTIINPASPQVPLPLHFSGSAKTDGELARISSRTFPRWYRRIDHGDSRAIDRVSRRPDSARGLLLPRRLPPGSVTGAADRTRMERSRR